MYTRYENTDEPVILLNTHIGFDAEDGQGIDAALWIDDLLYLDSLGKKRIQVWINSTGGIITDGMAMFNAILKTKTKVDTYNTGIAASISAVVFAAGAKRIMADYSVLMFHNAHGSSNTELLSTFNEAINEMISRTGMNKAAIEDMMNRTTYLNAQEAKQLGIATDIEDSADFNKARLTPAASAKEIHSVCNKFVEDKFKKSISMLKITNRLSLTDGANEDAVVAAITEVQNKLTASEAQNKATKEALDKMKNDMDEATNKYNAAKKELDETKDAAMEEKCKNMVTEFAKIGRIKNDEKVIAKWVAMAKVDFDATKGMIEDIPMNKEASKVTIVEKTEAGGIYNMAVAMAGVASKHKQL